MKLEKLVENVMVNLYESLNSQKQKYGDELVNKLLYLDISKNYKYIDQICKFYNEGISEDEIKNYIDTFDTRFKKGLLPNEYKDINHIKSFDELKDIIDNKTEEKSINDIKNSLSTESYVDTITTDKGEFNVYKPYNTLQTIKLGKHTKWCISAVVYQNMFNDYFIFADTRFYIFLKKNDKTDSEKYQMRLFPNGKKEIWNIVDDEIGCEEFKKLTDIDCNNYSWYHLTGHIVAYDQYEHKVGDVIDGKVEGKWTEYYDSTRIKYIANFKNSKFNGEYKQYYRNGNIKYEAVYKDDIAQGKEYSYWMNGNPKLLMHIKDDELDGKYEEYYRNGVLRKSCYYINGSLDGKYIEYYSNKVLHARYYYNDGSLDGKYEEYYNDGTLKVLCYYQNGKLDGEYKEWYKNGKLQLYIQYKNDMFDGKYIKYDENGNAVDKQYYKNDEELK